MPLYSYQCADCGAVADQYSRVSERDDNIPACHGPMTRQLCVSMVSVQTDICGASPIDGTVLTTHKGRREYMERNGLREALPADEIVRKTNAKKKALQDEAAKLPKLPEHLQKQMFEQAGFPG